MTRFGSNIVERLANDADRQAGYAFLDAIDPPYGEAVAHYSLLYGAKDFVARAHLSYGHRASANSPGARYPAAKLNVDEFMTEHAQTFTTWNTTTEVGAARLRVLDEHPVGAILCVGRHGPSGQMFITMVGSPVITPVNSDQINDYGAPKLSGVIPDDILHPDVVPGSVHTSHLVVASLEGLGGDSLAEELPDLVAQTKPVVMAASDRFHARLSPVAAGAADGPFKCLFFPKYCDPAVGLFWPVNIGFEGFYELMAGNKPYCALAKLLRAKRSEIEPWFQAAAERAADMVIQMTSVIDLWDSLPTEDDQLRPLCAPFLRQMSMFLWRQFCHQVLHHSASSAAEEQTLADFVTYLHAIDTHPSEVAPNRHLAAVDRPFIVQLYIMRSRPGVSNLVRPFLGWIAAKLVPEAIEAMGCVDLLPMAAGQPPRDLDMFTDFRSSGDSLSQHKANLVSQPSPLDNESIPGTDDQKPAAVDYNRSIHQHEVSRVTDDRSGSALPGQQLFSSQKDFGGFAGGAQSGYTPASDGYHAVRRLHFDDSARRSMSGQKRQFQAAVPGLKDPPQYTPAPGAYAPANKRPCMGSLQRAVPAASVQSPQNATVYGGFSQQVNIHPTATGYNAGLSGTQNYQPVQLGRPTLAGFFSPPRQTHQYGGGFQNVGFHGAPVGAAPAYYPQPVLPPLSIADASVADRDRCRRSPIEWVHATLFTLLPIPSTSHLLDVALGHARDPSAYAFVREPTKYAREYIFTMFDKQPPRDIHANVLSIIAHRFNVASEFPRTEELGRQDLLHLKSEFFSRLFQVTTWQICRGQPMRDVPAFHVLDFPAQLSMSGARALYLPTANEGYLLPFMHKLTKFLWSVMSLPQVEMGPDNCLQDRYFADSVFGSVLLKLCRAPFHYPLGAWWTAQYARQLTTNWFTDLVELFDLFSRFVEPKTLSGMTHSFVPMETSLQPNATVICTSVESRGPVGARSENFIESIKCLGERFDNRWSRPVYYSGDEVFHLPPASALLAPVDIAPKEDPSLSRLKTTKSATADREGDHPAQPFTAVKPLFQYVGTNGVVPAGKTPHDMLRDQANIRNWVKLLPARPPRSGRAGTPRQLCFQCAFVTSNTCPDKSKCKAGGSRFRRGRDGPQRLHIDLAHRDWSTYPAANWQPLIQFQNEHSAWIRPSEHLLAVVPEGWKME